VQNAGARVKARAPFFMGILAGLLGGGINIGGSGGSAGAAISGMVSDSTNGDLVWGTVDTTSSSSGGTSTAVGLLIVGAAVAIGYFLGNK
jgi:hypothetical protein